jgi:hypothetical protein
MALIKNVDGIDVPMTAQEEADFLADQTNATNALNLENATEVNFKTAVKNLLSTLPGKRYDQITAAEVRILVGLMVHEFHKGIDRNTGVYKPGNEWIK